jgi:hypothetical protein
MKIVRAVTMKVNHHPKCSVEVHQTYLTMKVNHHPKCSVEVHQTYLQELKGY